ncbi:NUDIX domain-containing protein [Candidatus Saccharibacteria bacterium]|nr:NUDIX domain-containing protein [Candidatus Saccharibacteria bacterium]
MPVAPSHEKKPFALYNRSALPDSTGTIEGAAGVWFYKREPDGLYILFQKRSKNVHNAGFYDMTAGGHIDAGEEASPISVAIREAKEEVGVSLAPEELDFLVSYISGDRYIFVYASDRTGKSDQFSLDEYEVESLKWVKVSELETFAEQHAKKPLRENPLHLPALKFYFSALESDGNL